MEFKTDINVYLPPAIARAFNDEVDAELAKKDVEIAELKLELQETKDEFEKMSQAYSGLER